MYEMLMTPTRHSAGAALRLWRRRRLLKQSHVAALLEIDQSTLSRWERGTVRLSDDAVARIWQVMEGAALPEIDGPLRRLVEACGSALHLICDRSHRLLAASPARDRQWASRAPDLRGRSLRPYMSETLLEAEARFSELTDAPAGTWPALWGLHDGTAHPDVPLRPGAFLWERLRLDDGSVVRLCWTLPRSALPPEGAIVMGTGLPGRTDGRPAA